MTVPTPESFLTAWSNLPPELRRVITTSVATLFTKGAGKAIGWFVLGSEERRATERALECAIAVVLRDHPSLHQIGFGEAVARAPFSELVQRVIAEPTSAINDHEIREAFEQSKFDLASVGVDEVRLLSALQSAFMEALRLGQGSASRELHAVTRIEQTHSLVTTIAERLEDRLGMPDEVRIRATMAQAKRLFDDGEMTSALKVWEEVWNEVRLGTHAPGLRARVLRNIAVCHANQARLDEALRYIELALQYEPQSLVAMSLKVELLVNSDRPADAQQVAAAMLAVDESAPEAWIALVMTSESMRAVDQLPSHLQEHPDVLFAVGLSAQRLGEHTVAVGALRRSLQLGARWPRRVLALADGLLKSLYPRSTLDTVPQHVLEEIDWLCRELQDDPQLARNTDLQARVMFCRGHVSQLRGEEKTALEQFDNAFALSPTSLAALYATVRVRLREREGAVARYLLEKVPVADRDVLWHALRASAEVACAEDADISEYVQAIAGAPRGADQAQAAAMLLEELLDGVNVIHLEAAEHLLALVVDHMPSYMQHLYRARMADGRKELTSAAAEYESSLGSATGSAREQISLEVASALCRYGDQERAVDLFGATSLTWNNPTAVRLYAKCLFDLKRWEPLDALLATELAADRSATWALACDAQVALMRNDLPRAKQSLSRLTAERPNDPEVHLQLAGVMLRLGERDEARRAMTNVLTIPSVVPSVQTHAALLLLRLGDAREAIHLASQAIRRAPDDEDVQQHCLLNVFIAAESAGHDLAALFATPVVGGDTVVVLENQHGEHREVTIWESGPVDIAKEEYLASDTRVAALIGKARGEEWTTWSGDQRTAERVVSIDSAVLRALQLAFAAFEKRFPDQRVLRAVFVGEGDEFDPRALVVRLQRQRQRVDAVLARYRQGPVPVDHIAMVKGCSVRRAYLGLLADTSTRVLVDLPSMHALGEAAVCSEQAVLTVTGIATLAELGLLSVLPDIVARLLAPRSLVDELSAELAEWEDAVARREYASVEVLEDALVRHQESVQDVRRVRDHVARIRDFVVTRATVLPRPARSQQDLDALQGGLLPSSVDALALMGPGATLFSDDLALRMLAQEVRGDPGFASVTLLERALVTARLDEQATRTARRQLMDWRYTVVPVHAEELATSIAEEGGALTARVRRMLAGAFDPLLPFGERLSRGVDLLRRIAVGVADNSSKAAVATAVAECLTAGTDGAETAPAFLSALRSAMRLVPVAGAVIIASVRDVVVARGLPTVPDARGLIVRLAE
jgi:tetratricopeptide (TPR) repeat protein